MNEKERRGKERKAIASLECKTEASQSSLFSMNIAHIMDHGSSQNMTLQIVLFLNFDPLDCLFKRQIILRNRKREQYGECE